MSLFEFISSMISVLIALAVAQLLVSIGRLAQNHDRVRPYLPHGLWSAYIFLVAFLHWWSLWDFRDLPWNSAMFFYSLLGPLLLFFSVTLLNPDVRPDDEVVDLRAHYEEVRPLFLGVLLAALLAMTFDGPLFGTEPLFNVLRASQLFIALMIVAAMLIRHPAIQVISSGLALVMVTYATTVRFLPGYLNPGLPLSGN